MRSLEGTLKLSLLLNRLSYKIPFIRGNDGLTGRERRFYARRWRAHNKPPTKEEMQRLRELAPVYRRDENGKLNKIADNYDGYLRIKNE